MNHISTVIYINNLDHLLIYIILLYVGVGVCEINCYTVAPLASHNRRQWQVTIDDYCRQL